MSCKIMNCDNIVKIQKEFNAKEKYRISNTLGCIPVMLQGCAVLVDLRDETSVAGVIDFSDGLMNLHLTEAVLIDRNGGQYPFEEFMVLSRLIRQIHIPADIDMEQELRTAMDAGGIFSRKKLAKPRSGKRTFKQKRAEQRHLETLDHIKQLKESQQ